MTTFTTSTVIHAPHDQVWATLSDIGSIDVWSPGVKGSHAISEKDSGLGAARHCDLGGRNYVREEVVEFDEGERITMRVIDSSLPFEAADIRFQLIEEGDRTHVTVEPEYRLKFGLVGTMLDRLFVRRKYEAGMKTLLHGLKQHLESDVPAI